MNRLRASAALLSACWLMPQAALADRAVVLATGDACPVEEISSLDVRKAYLGVAVSIDGHSLRPIRLAGDELLEQIFYQSIVAMSQKSYERRVLSLALKFGTPRPEVIDNLESAIDVLREHVCSIVYLWQEDAEELEEVRIVRLLWQGD